MLSNLIPLSCLALLGSALAIDASHSARASEAAKAKLFDHDSMQIVASVVRAESSLRPDTAALTALSILFDADMLKKALAINEMPSTKQRAAAIAFVQPIAAAVAKQEASFQAMVASNEELLYTLQDNGLQEGAIFALLKQDSLDQFSSMASLTGSSLASAASAFFGSLAEAEHATLSAAQLRGAVPTALSDLSSSAFPQQPIIAATPSPTAKGKLALKEPKMISDAALVSHETAAAKLDVKRRRSEDASLSSELASFLSASKRDGVLSVSAEIFSTLQPQAQRQVLSTSFAQPSSVLPQPQAQKRGERRDMLNVNQMKPGAQKRTSFEASRAMLIQRDALDDIVLPTSTSSQTAEMPIISQPPRPMEPGMMAQSFDATTGPSSLPPFLPQQVMAATPKGIKSSGSQANTQLQRGLGRALGMSVLACLGLGSLLCILL